MRRLVSCAVLACAASLSVGVSGNAAATDVHDTVSVAGFDYNTYHSARVVSAESNSSLLITFQSGRQLTNGRVRLTLPTADWRTSLHPAAALNGVDPNVGAVVVQPAAALHLIYGVPAREACSWPSEQPRVEHRAHSQVIEVSPLTCRPGQRITIRIVNVQAPSTPGLYQLNVRSRSDHGTSSSSTATVHVSPPPRVALEVSVPATVTNGEPFTVTVTARRRDGAVASGYRGSIALVTADFFDCSQKPSSEEIAHTFTAADAGVGTMSMTLTSISAHRIIAYDVAHRAVPGTSDAFTHDGPDLISVCPIHYD